MKKITISATKARTQFFDLLRSFRSSDQEIIILNEKTNEIIGRLLPPEKKTDWKKLGKALRASKCVLTTEDVKQIKKVREESRIPRFPDW